VGTKAMTSIKKRLLILELVAAGQMPLDEARRRRAEILQRSRRGRILLRIERAERIVGGAPR
jgi:polyhydroxyalkanoate synthesis regulator phasin